MIQLHEDHFAQPAFFVRVKFVGTFFLAPSTPPLGEEQNNFCWLEWFYDLAILDFYYSISIEGGHFAKRVDLQTYL